MLKEISIGTGIVGFIIMGMIVIASVLNYWLPSLVGFLLIGISLVTYNMDTNTDNPTGLTQQELDKIDFPE